MVEYIETAAAIVMIVSIWELTKAAFKLVVKEYRRAKSTL